MSRRCEVAMQPGAAGEKTAVQRGAAERIEIFEYPADANTAAAHDWSGFSEGEDEDAAAPSAPDPAFEQRLAEETRRAFEQGRERGRLEGRQAERESMSAALKTTQDNQLRQMAGLAEGFAAARERYLANVEHEVVKLALAIAARILRREAQMDPLLLTGAARVALGQLSSTTEVRLRVPAGELDLWTEAMNLIPNLPLRPTVVAGEGMQTGECLVETALGTVDLGIRAQLAEIERGFFDRPALAPDAAFRQERRA